eukprot:TRINITY_DN8780_c0_g2_i3.p1 TRINITY_DN8780_c0_g2~~TRINITY_DN8780_c0_g2_i3.p1  ORF type:complete len:419 (+),score=64.67 TRINITY_DN8780_c0_g2_i3:106-1257(+)
MDTEPPKKVRKKIVPGQVSPAPSAQPPTAPTVAQPQAAQKVAPIKVPAVPASPAPNAPLEGVGAADSVQSTTAGSSAFNISAAGGRYVIKFLPDGGQTGLKWEHAVPHRPQLLSASCEFVAISLGEELRILNLKDGSHRMPPCNVGSSIVRLEAKSGFVAVVARDASLIVFDLKDVPKCSIRTTLRHVCEASELETLAINPNTGEPLIPLNDGEIKLYDKELKVWTILSNLRNQTTSAQPLEPAALSLTRSIASSKQSRDTLTLESDLLAWASLGDPQHFQISLQALARHCLERAEVTRLRDWCSVLMGGTTDFGWLDNQILAMGLNTKSLISKNVLNVIAVPGSDPPASANAQELRAQLEEMIKAPAAAVPIINGKDHGAAF